MFNVWGMAYRRREWMVTMSHLWTMVSRNMFLRLNLIFNLVSDVSNVFFIPLILLFFIYKIQKLMMKWRVLTLFCINMYRITQERYSIFLFMIVKSTPVFLVFSVGRNEDKFVICLRVKVFRCTILIEYSVVHPEWTLKHDFSTKIGTLFFLDFHSVRHFRPTFYLVFQIICNNFWFVRFFDLNKYSE